MLTLGLGFWWGRQSGAAAGGGAERRPAGGLSADVPGRAFSAKHKFTAEDLQELYALLSDLSSPTPALLASLYSKIQQDMLAGRDVGVQMELVLVLHGTRGAAGGL